MPKGKPKNKFRYTYKGQIALGRGVSVITSDGNEVIAIKPPQTKLTKEKT